MVEYESLTKEDLVLLHKYQIFFNYTYNCLVTAPRKHKDFTKEFISYLMKQPKLFYEAMKSSQKGKLYVADAGIAHIRSLLKLCPHKDPERRIIALPQVEQAEVLLSEVGSIFGTMLKNHKSDK